MSDYWFQVFMADPFWFSVIFLGAYAFAMGTLTYFIEKVLRGTPKKRYRDPGDGYKKL